MKYIIDTDKLPCNNGKNCTTCPFWSMDDTCEITEQVKKLPKYEERPHGEWVWKKDKDSLRTYDLLCSECGCKIFTCENFDSIEQAQKTIDDLVKDGKTMPNYCLECGSDNRKRGEAE